MNKPKNLPDGGRIAIVAPSGAIAPEYLDKGIALIQSKGYSVEVMPHVRDCRTGVFAATDAQRASDMEEAILRDDIDAIICARGGYGAVRTIQHMKKSVVQRCDKWLVGFSDITVFHSALTHYGIASIHGPMLKHIAVHGIDSDDVKKTFDLMRGKKVSVSCESALYSRSGKVSGKLIGGNLSLIYSLRRTAIDIAPKGAILFIEDLSEYNYHIDRMMQNLKYSGVLAKLGGLVVGQMTDMKDGATAFGSDAYAIIADAVAQYDYPVLMGYPAGHADEVNMPLRMGGEATLRVDAKGQSSLTFA